MKNTLLVVLISTLAGASVLEAQRTGERPARDQERQRVRWAPVPEAGVRALYDFDTRDFGLGAHAQIPVTTVLRFAPSAEVYFGDDTTWQANADVVASLLLLRAGGGLAVVDGGRVGSDSPELGLNLFVGLQGLPRRDARFRPFLDVRWTLLQDATPLRLAAGVNIPIGARR